jgi:adenosylcobinamide-GDP ribazoletransferase
LRNAVSTAPADKPRAAERAIGPAPALPPPSIFNRLAEAPAAALLFLTVVPLPRRLRPTTSIARSDGAAWYPLVGAGIGALAGALRLIGYKALGAGPATALAFLVAVGITGALHQDALANCADALGGRQGHASRPAVTRGSTLGVYGILAIGLWGLLMFASLEQMTAVNGLLALLTASAAGRLVAVLHGVFVEPAARVPGASDFAPTSLSAGFAVMLTCVISILAVGVRYAAITIVVCAIWTTVSAVLTQRVIGGRTADTLGAAAAVTEVTMVVVLSALLMTR